MFSIGDRVAYPMHGAGIIEDIVEREIMGDMKRYYVLYFSQGNLKLMLPVEKTEDLGLRDVLKENDIPNVYEILKQTHEDVSKNWNQRYRENLERLKTGNIYSVADVVRILTIRDREKGLSTGEKKMLNKAKQILVSELILACDKGENEISDLIELNID